MDRESAQALVLVVAGGLGFAFVLGLTRDVLDDSTAAKVVVLIVWGVVGLVLTWGLGVAIESVPPLQLQGIRSPDDVGGYLAAMPWYALDARLGEGFTMKCTVGGMAAGLIYEGARFLYRRG